MQLRTITVLAMAAAIAATLFAGERMRLEAAPTAVIANLCHSRTLGGTIFHGAPVCRLLRLSR